MLNNLQSSLLNINLAAFEVVGMLVNLYCPGVLRVSPGVPVTKWHVLTTTSLGEGPGWPGPAACYIFGWSRKWGNWNV